QRADFRRDEELDRRRRTVRRSHLHRDEGAVTLLALKTNRSMPCRRIALLLLCVAALRVSLAAFVGTAQRPNIVFILIDDMGWRDIGANGSKYYRTPNIDRLAKEGLRFTNGYASCAVCSPSRAAIMTGQNPARLHITDWIPGEGPRKD